MEPKHFLSRLAEIKCHPKLQTVFPPQLDSQQSVMSIVASLDLAELNSSRTSFPSLHVLLK